MCYNIITEYWKEGTKTMKKMDFKPLLYGLVTAGIMWVVMLIGDLIDETLRIDFLSGFILIATPLFLAYLIITHKLNKSIGDLIRKKINRPRKKERSRPTKFKYITYIAIYNFAFSFIWSIISKLAFEDKYIIPQHHVGNDINGTEYVLYGWTAIIFFDLIMVLFAVVYILIKLIRKIINKQKLCKETNE